MKHEKNSELSKFFIQYKKHFIVGLSVLVLSSGVGFALVQNSNQNSTNEKVATVKEKKEDKESKKVSSKKDKNKISKSEKKHIDKILEESNELGNQTQRLLTPKERNDVQTILKSKTPDVVKQLLASKEKKEETIPPLVPTNPNKPIIPDKPLSPPIAVESTPKIQATQNNILAVGSLFDPYNYFSVSDALDNKLNIIVDTSEIDNMTSGTQFFTVTAINKFSKATSVRIPIQFVHKPELFFKQPVIALTIGESLDLNQAFATDEIEGDISDRVVVEKNDFILNTEGTFFVTYSITNSYGLKTERTLTVNVINEKPTLTGGVITHEINQPINLAAGVTAIAYNGETIAVTENNIVDTNVNINKEGQYHVSYQVSDRFGKQSDVFERTVIVENEAPVIHNFNSAEFHVGSTITKEDLLKDVILTDREDDRQNLPLELVVNEEQFSAIDSNVPGTYPFTISTTDSMGKTTTKTIEVKIINDLPVLHGIEDVEIELGAPFDPMEGVSATDAETPQLIINYEYVGQPLDVNIAGEYVIHYSVTDAHGGKAEANRTVTVKEMKRENIVSEAKKWLGSPYSWGGGTIDGPTVGKEQDANVVGFDCSSFVQYLMNKQGVKISRTTTEQENEGTEVPMSEIKPGDLLFFGTRGNTHHVALYIGNNEFIHAPESGDVIKITNITNFKPSFARRVLN